jgi:nucleoside 2-deoxyribosyltransferase
VRVYLAAPLFGAGEREFNTRLANSIVAGAPEIHVILPQDEAPRLLTTPQFAERMFSFCLETIDRVDAVVAVLDGADTDSGTCVECGYAFARGVPIVGIRTDLRQSEVRGLNLMVSGVCRHLLYEPRHGITTEQIAALAVAALRELDARVARDAPTCQ